jgi:DNA-binding transcriptional regulator GbsR (MarR family)
MQPTLLQIHKFVKLIKLMTETSRMSPMAEPTAEFVEGFALVLNRAGMQRMAARVFAALLAADKDGLTAKQIGAALGVSPAAVSGAVGYLTSTGLANRVREPGARVDHYAVDSTTWAEAIAMETDRLRELVGWLSKGAAAAPPDSTARARMTETREFFEFLTIEMPKLVERWRASRA